MNYIELHLGDYLRDTSHLTPTEHGIYLLLLLRYYADEAPIPDAQAHRYVRAPRAEVEAILHEFFTRDGAVWRHARVEAEIARCADKRSKAKRSAESRWSGLRSQYKTDANAMRTHSERNANGMLPNHQTPEAHVERLSQPEPAAPPPGPAPASGRTRRPRAKSVKPEPPSAPTWISYAEAYRTRYGVEPVRNKKVNGMLCRFVERVGADASPSVAAFFVQLNRGLYVSARHAVDLMLRDAEGLHTDWQRGHAVTDHEARALDRTQTNLNAFEPLLRAARESEAMTQESTHDEPQSLIAAG